MTSATPLVSAVPDELRGWMEYAVASGASDLHLVPGYPPVVRKHGDLNGGRLVVAALGQSAGERRACDRK